MSGIMDMRRIIAVAVLAALGLLGAGCASTGDDDATTRDESGEIVGEGEIGAFRIKVGDCLGAIDGGSQIETAQGVPCTGEHQYEVYHSFDIPDGDFPGDSAVSTSAQDGCLAEFETFVGIAYEESIYGFTSLLPTEESWDRLDDREVLCLIGNFDGTPKSGSAQGSAV